MTSAMLKAQLEAKGEITMPIEVRDDGIILLKCVQCDCYYGAIFPEGLPEKEVPEELLGLGKYEKPTDVLCPTCRSGTRY
jgi:hypothetical protein